MAYAKVTGTVTKPLLDKGYEISETVTVAFGPSAGQSWPVRWAVWTKQPLNLGDLVDVAGELTVKQREYLDERGNPKTVIDRSVNADTITVARAAQPTTGSEPF